VTTYTTNCKIPGQPEVIFSLQTESYAPANWLMAYLESSIKSGVRFSGLQKLQIGSVVTLLKGGENEKLEIWEPDFSAMPINWRFGVDRTLRYFAIQKAVCDELNVETTFPSILEPAMVSRRFLLQANQCLMSRDDPNPSDSGWAFYGENDDGSDGEYQSLYEIALRATWVIPFLALPPGAVVARTPETLKIEFKGREMSSASDTLMSDMLNFNK
jgi:hypothetical protein